MVAGIARQPNTTTARVNAGISHHVKLRLVQQHDAAERARPTVATLATTRSGPSVPAEALEGLVQFAIFQIGSKILSATTAEELEDRLDDVLAEDALYDVETLAAGLARPTRGDIASGGSEFLKAIGAPLGRSAKKLWRSEAKFIGGWFQAQLQLLVTNGSNLPPTGHRPRETEREAEESRPSPAMLYDATIPLEFIEIAAAALRASACLLGLIYANEVGTRVPDAIGAAMVHRIGAGARLQLKLLAALPGAEVPRSLVPQPLDIQGIVVRHERYRALVALQFARADGAL